LDPSRATLGLLGSLGLAACGPGASVDVWELGLRLTAPQLAGDDAPATLGRASWALDGVRLTACDDATLGWIRGFDRDERPRTLTEPIRDPRDNALRPVTALGVDLPAGAWCRAEIAPAGPLEVALTTPRGAEVVLALQLGALSLVATPGAPFGERGGAVDAPTAPTDLTLQLGGADWLAPVEAELALGGTLKVASGSPAHDPLLRALLAPPTGLYEAADADLSLSADELAAAPVAEPPPLPTEPP
jgi:hypothetical protein